MHIINTAWLAIDHPSFVLKEVELNCIHPTFAEQGCVLLWETHFPQLSEKSQKWILNFRSTSSKIEGTFLGKCPSDVRNTYNWNVPYRNSVYVSVYTETLFRISNLRSLKEALVQGQHLAKTALSAHPKLIC